MNIEANFFKLLTIPIKFQLDDSASVSGHQLPMVNVNVGRNNVLNRVTNQQDKWKRQVSRQTPELLQPLTLLPIQVQEQRSRIYNQHSMLN
jgi:hypothetical protein